MKAGILEFYMAQSRLTDPGKYARNLEDLPTDLAGLHTALNGLMIHSWRMQKDHPEILAERSDEIKIRHIRKLLEKVFASDDRHLNIAREESKRLIVDCRHFAALMCTVLRHREIPARSRWGFATYLEKTHYQNHCLCEYWDAKEDRWVLEDPDLEMHDVSPDQFIMAGRAWQMCREDQENGTLFGYGRHPRGQGLSKVRGILVSDLAALNGFEMLSDDWWGILLKNNKYVTKEDTALLDRAALLTLSDEGFDERREFYEDNQVLRVPDTIETHAPGSGHHLYIDWQKEA